MLGDLFNILFIALRQNDRRDLGSFRGENFFFQTADGKDAASQRDFSRHGHITADGNTGQNGGNGGGHRDACRRAIFGNRAGGHMDVDVYF